MQVFSVQIWLLSGLVISYAYPGQQLGETTVTSKGLPDSHVASFDSGDHTFVDNSPNVQATIRSDANPITDTNSLRDQNTNNFPPSSKWPVPQSAVEFGSFLNQSASNVTNPSGSAQLGVVFPTASDPQVLQAPFAYKPDRPSVIQHLLSNVQAANNSTNTFFIIPSSTTTEATTANNDTAMNDPIPNPLPGIITASQSTVNNATNAAQEITNLWGTNVQNGFFGSANALGNRPSNDAPASESTDNPLQGIIGGSQASWNNATGTAQSIAGQFGANVQNGLSNLFGINLNRPSNDEPVRPARPSNDEAVTQSTEAGATTEAGTSSTASNETTSPTEAETTSTASSEPTSTESTASESSTTTVSTTTSGVFLPLVSFVNNTQTLLNSSVLLQTVTNQLTGNLPNGLGNFFLPRPSKTKQTIEQQLAEPDVANQGTAALKTVNPPPRPSCPTCTSTCFYRPFQQQRIVGGTDVQSANTYPWIALLTYLDSPSGQGSLINDRAIVTTATIVENMPVKKHIRALLGVYNRADTNETISSQKIKTTYIHPGYSTSNQFADNIGLLILKNALSNFQPICLPVPRPQSPPVPKATIIGWGASYAGGPLANILQEHELQMYAPLVCFMTTFQATRKNLCGGTTQFTSKAGATCTGDGGDPLVARNAVSWELIGVALDIPAFECGKDRTPAMFTGIIPHLEWITTYGAGCECYVG